MNRLTHTASIPDMASKAALLMRQHADIVLAKAQVTSPLVQKGNDIFERAVRRNGFHFQSNALKSVLRELRQFQQLPTIASTLRLKDALATWSSQHPAEVAARIEAKSSSCLDELQASVQARATLHDLLPSHSADVNSCMNEALRDAPEVTGWNRLCPGQTLEQYRGALPEFQRKLTIQTLVQQASAAVKKRFGHVVFDAPALAASTPGRKGIQAHRSDVLAHSATRAAARQAHCAAEDLTKLPRHTPPSGRAFAELGRLMDLAGTGTGLSLAYSAAGELLHHNTEGVRVEVIALPDPDAGSVRLDYIVVVARADDSRLHDRSTWGPDVQIMGHWKSVSVDALSIPKGKSLLDTRAHVDVPTVPRLTRAQRKDADIQAALVSLIVLTAPTVSHRAPPL